jgi:hypothetical protein
MSWIRACLELNKSLILKGLLLLMAFLLGLQMGQSRLQRQWDAEKQIVQIAQAKQEQHAADVAHVRNQISKEISDDYRKKSSLLANRSVLAGRVLDKSDSSSVRLSAISSHASRAASTIANVVPSTEGDFEQMRCDQLFGDATQTTLMLLEIQRWYEKQVTLGP